MNRRDQCPKGLENCPTAEQLEAFDSGLIESEQLDEVAKCVTDCNECTKALEALQQKIDPLVAELRETPSTDTGAPEECDELISKVESIASEPVAAASSAEGSLGTDGIVLAKLQTPPQPPPGHEQEKSSETIDYRPADQENDHNTINKGTSETIDVEEADAQDAELQSRKKAAIGGKELIGQDVGEYRILEMLGAGGMGQVFIAEHRRMERKVALKVLPGDALGSRDSVARFQREVRAAAKLSHPNIVTAFDAGEQAEMLYLVMEYVKGTNLEKRVFEEGPMPVEDAVDAILQAAKGFKHAHEQGIVHRDIKPANLIIDEHRVVKVLDMGLARISSGIAGDNPRASMAGRRLTKAGTLLGTIDYMAPEQALDVKSADHRADIYSLGCTLYFMLTGKPPFKWENVLEAVMAHNSSDIPSLRKERPEVPAQLEAIYTRMLAKDREDRYQRMEEVVEDLEACKRRIIAGPSLGETLTSKPALIAAAAVAAIALGALVIWLAMG